MVASRLRYSNLLGLTSPPLIRSCMHGMWPYLFLRGRMFTKMTLVFERVVCKLWEGRGVYLWKVGYICFLMVRMEYLWNGVCSWRDSSVSSRKDICSASAAIKEKLYMHGSFQFQRCIFVSVSVSVSVSAAWGDEEEGSRNWKRSSTLLVKNLGGFG